METSTPDLVFEYRITQADFVGAFLTHYRNSGPIRRILFYLYPVLGVMFVVLAVLMAVMQIRNGEASNGPIPLFLVGAAWLACYFGRPLWLGRLYRKDQRYRTPIRMSIAGDEMNVITATAEARFKRGTFVRALETNQLILLYHSPIMFSFIPKRDLTSDQQAKFAAFLDRELPVRRGRNRLPTPSSPAA